jgi:DNA-binding LacI/PurR family transcriptional regulator
VQCLIAPSINGNDAAPLAKLALPSAFLCNPYSKHTVDYDTTQFFRGSAQRLAAQGCRSVGLISNTLPVDHEYDAYRHFFTNFSQAIEREGLVTRAEWIRHPTTPSTDLAGIGYREFKEIWRQAERPDALIVTPDTVAQGAIISILETGGGIVLPRMKFLFHRNAHLPFLCPFPATWGVTNEDLLADALIDLIDKQFAGIRVEPGYLDYTFDHGVSLAAQI